MEEEQVPSTTTVVLLSREEVNVAGWTDIYKTIRRTSADTFAEGEL